MRFAANVNTPPRVSAGLLTEAAASTEVLTD
jgi:hypothetical protein